MAGWTVDPEAIGTHPGPINPMGYAAIAAAQAPNPAGLPEFAAAVERFQEQEKARQMAELRLRLAFHPRFKPFPQPTPQQSGLAAMVPDQPARSPDASKARMMVDGPRQARRMPDGSVRVFPPGWAGYPQEALWAFHRMMGWPSGA